MGGSLRKEIQNFKNRPKHLFFCEFNDSESKTKVFQNFFLDYSKSKNTEPALFHEPKVRLAHFFSMIALDIAFQNNFKKNSENFTFREFG